MSHEFFISELDRRLSHMVKLGVIEAVNPKKARVRIRIGNILTAWRPWTAGSSKAWCLPEVGEQVVFISPSGDTAQGVAIPSIYSNKMKPPSDDPNVICFKFKDGKIQYDSSSKKMIAEVSGSKIEIEKDKVKLSSGGSSIELKTNQVNINAAVINLNGIVNL